MNETTAVVVVLVAFFALLALEVPVGLGLGLSGALGIMMFTDVGNATNVLSAIPYATTAKYALFVVPMYILLGSLVNQAGIATQIYRAVNRVVGRLPGGLGATTVFATALFSGVSGSSAADVATFGRVSVNAMSRFGYPKPYSAAVVAASVAFAALIPPSITIVIYGITAQLSIGALILAAVIPGVLSSVVLAVFIVVSNTWSQRRHAPKVVEPVAATAGAGRGSTGPASAPVAPEVGSGTTGEKMGDLVAMGYALVLFVIVIGGIYTGLYTATEAGAIGAFAALVIAILIHRSRSGSLRGILGTGLKEAADVTGMVFLLLIGGGVFAYFVTTAGVPSAATEWALGLSVDPKLIVAVILLLMIPLGMFLDGLSIMLLVVPLAAPVVVAMGFDGIWFGILMLKLIEIGLLTPPVGINVFIIAGIVDVPAESVFRKIGIFVALDLAVTAALFAFPDIVLWLPRVAGMI